MDGTKRYYGVNTCIDHKTIGFQDKDAESLPSVEQQGACGLCYWFDEKQNALNKIDELIEQGYSLHRVLDYPNYYTGNGSYLGNGKQTKKKELLKSQGLLV